MKLFKEGNGVWAGRTALDAIDDIDIEVRAMTCGKSITTIRIARNYCRSGIISSYDYDGLEIEQRGVMNAFLGRDTIRNGEAKLFSWTERPFKVLLQGKKPFLLEYES